MNARTLVLAALFAAPAAAEPGDTLWTIEVEDQYAYAWAIRPPAVAADGTLYWYCLGLRAITPGGQQLWTEEDCCNEGNVILSPDQTRIYANGWVNMGTPDEPSYAETLRAMDRDGNVVWDYFFHDNWGAISSGPVIGGDGSLYMVVNGPGYRQPGPAISIAQDGWFRWETANGFLTSALAMNRLDGPDGRLYITADRVPNDSGGYGGTVGIDLDGNIAWTHLYSFVHLRAPAALPSGEAVYQYGLNSYGLISREPSGSENWHFPYPHPLAGGTHPVVDPADGSIYLMFDGRDLVKVDSSGSILWRRDDATGPVSLFTTPVLSPDGRTIVITSQPCIGDPYSACSASVTAVNTDDGTVRWRREMPYLGGERVGAGRVSFSPDSSAVYVATEAYVSHWMRLLAIDAGSPDECAADLDADGSLTLGDFVSFRNMYVAGNMAADFDGSGTLTLADFVSFRNAYVAGCP